MAKKTPPQLRQGLTVDELTCDWLKEQRWISTTTIKTMEYAIKRVLAEVNCGEPWGRQDIITLFTEISQAATFTKYHIQSGMNDGKFTPTILDRIANA